MQKKVTIVGIHILLASFFIACGSGCVTPLDLYFVQDFSLGNDTKTFDVEKVRLCNDYLEAQQYAEALAVIRQEIYDPVISNQEQLAYIRINGIYALAEYVRFQPFTPDLDAEAFRYYREGLQYAHAQESSQVTLHHMMALYYSLSDRNGAMLPYMQKELEYYRRKDDTYQLIVCYDGLANGYSDAGQEALAHYYRQLVLDMAGRYFVLDKHPDFDEKGYQWVNYVGFLGSAMDDLAEPGKSDKILELWKNQEPIIKAYITPEYIAGIWIRPNVWL